MRQSCIISNLRNYFNIINFLAGDVEKSLKNMSGADFEAKYKRAKPDASALIIFSCKSGKRAAAATDKAIKLGFNKYVNSLLNVSLCKMYYIVL